MSLKDTWLFWVFATPAIYMGVRGYYEHYTTYVPTKNPSQICEESGGVWFRGSTGYKQHTTGICLKKEVIHGSKTSTN